jgi:hypothetical protein
MDFYMYITAKAKAGGFTNTPGQFLIDVPYHASTLRDQWECALVEISMDCSFEPQSDRLYMCGEFLEESSINGDKQQQVLRNIEVRGKYTEYLNERYTNRNYVRCLHGFQHYSTWRFKMLDENLKTVNFSANELHAVLHFRQKQS